MVDLPVGIVPRDYLITVSRGNGQSPNDEYDLTIGAVGQGRPHEMGPSLIVSAVGLFLLSSTIVFMRTTACQMKG